METTQGLERGKNIHATDEGVVVIGQHHPALDGFAKRFQGFQQFPLESGQPLGRNADVGPVLVTCGREEVAITDVTGTMRRTMPRPGGSFPPSKCLLPLPLAHPPPVIHGKNGWFVLGFVLEFGL
jgi:hypothetical protein